MDIYTLLKIFFVAGSYLRGVHCASDKDKRRPSIDVFKDVVNAFYRGDGPQATFISAENIVMTDTRCFVALLNHMQYNIIKPEDAKPEKLEVYKHYFLTNIQRLNTDVFLTYRKEIIDLYRDFNKDKMSEVSGTNGIVSASEIQVRAKTLVNIGSNENMWYLDTDFLTERISNKFDAEYTREHKYFEKCSAVYETLKPSNSVLNRLIHESMLNLDSFKRLNLYKSMPLVMKEHLELFVLTKQTEMIARDENIYLYDIINSILTYYGTKIITWLQEAEILLVFAYYSLEEKERRNKWFFDSDYCMNHLTIVVHIVEQIRIIVSKFRFLLGFDIKVKTDLSKEFEELYEKQLNRFNTNKDLIMNGKEIPDPSSYNIESLTTYPDLLFYYPNQHLLKIPASDKTTKLLLNLQAWITVIPLKLESTIIACQLLDLNRPSTKKILDQQLQIGDVTTSSDKVMERIYSKIDTKQPSMLRSQSKFNAQPGTLRSMSKANTQPSFIRSPSKIVTEPSLQRSESETEKMISRGDNITFQSSPSNRQLTRGESKKEIN